MWQSRWQLWAKLMSCYNFFKVLPLVRIQIIQDCCFQAYRRRFKSLSDFFLPYTKDEEQIINLHWYQFSRLCWRWLNWSALNSMLKDTGLNPTRNCCALVYSSIMDELYRQIKWLRSRQWISESWIRISVVARHFLFFYSILLPLGCCSISSISKRN